VHSILVVEDEAVTRRLLDRLLVSEGYAVYLAETGAVGLEIIREVQPALVILDLVLPDMNGRDFFLRARSVGFSGLFLILSGYGARPAQQELGAEASLAKPFDPDDLLQLVTQMLSGNAPNQKPLDNNDSL
jgi:two-component system, OmpR family, response regulator MprA